MAALDGGETDGLSRKEGTSRAPCTFVPIPEGRHDEKADGLIGPLLQDRGGESLVCPFQTCSQHRSERGGDGTAVKPVQGLALSPLKA